MLLAVTGIYAVVAFSVSLRTQEIAIRVALGAQRAGIARLVLLSGAKMALLGCGLGVLGSLAVSRIVNSFLFEVSATNPLIYLGSVLVMMFMAVLTDRNASPPLTEKKISRRSKKIQAHILLRMASHEARLRGCAASGTDGKDCFVVSTVTPRKKL